VPPGCPFHPRCAFAFDRCSAERPLAEPVAPGSAHLAACHIPAVERPARREVGGRTETASASASGEDGA